MRFVTWNVSSARSPDGRVDLDRFAAAVASLDADVLALQEVDRDQPRSHGADLTRVAATAMGADHHVFAPALHGTPGRRWTPADGTDRDGAAYGCALVSRTALSDVQVVRMPAAPVLLPLWIPGAGVVPVREEPRVAIVARLERPAALTVVCTHLPFVPVWKQRQLRRVVEAVRARPDPLLLLGDLNLRGSAPARLTGFASLATHATFPAARPRLQLDHVLLRGAAATFGSVTATSAPRLAVSDHRPLVVDVEVRGGG